MTLDVVCGAITGIILYKLAAAIINFMIRRAGSTARRKHERQGAGR